MNSNFNDCRLNNNSIFILFFFFLQQDDVLRFFDVCLNINPADINLVEKCCKPLAKLLPRLGPADEDTLKSSISWILSCIASLENHKCHLEQINYLLNFYASTIQTCGNLNINNNKVRHFFHSLDSINLTLK